MDPDPWNWSVTDVQQFFRDTAASYVADYPHGRLPAPEPFLTSLNDNDVSGAILLTAVDASTLKEELGIASLGVRSTVIHCIRKLKRQSVTYSNDDELQVLRTPSSMPLRILPSAPAQQPPATPLAENVGEHVRAGEVQVQDAHGRKRRKLDMSGFQLVKQPEHSAAANVITRAGQGYLGDSACPVDELFYGQNDFGREVKDLQPIGDVLVWPIDQEAGRADQNFQFGDQNKPAGEARYVFDQMRHFLAKDEHRNLRRQGRDATGVLPYRETISREARSATVFQFRGDASEPIAVRENAAYLDSGYNPEEQMQSGGDWDFLIQKHKSKEDELLPVYGESDIDEADLQTLTTSEANGEEEAAEQADSRFLDPDRVAEIIENAIQRYITDWEDDLPELEQKKAWTVWNMTKKSRTIRDGLIQSTQAKIDHLTARLNKMKVELQRDTWKTEDSLIKECDILEVTVEDREELRWKINIWKRRQEPAHTIHHGKKRSHSSQQTPGSRETAGPGFVVHPSDRLSISPAPGTAPEADVGMEEAIRYEADDEEFHTPVNSPQLRGDATYTNSEPPDDWVLVADENNDISSVKEESDVESPTPNAAVATEAEPTGKGNDSNYSPGESDSESSDLAHPSTWMKRRILPPKPNDTAIPSTEPIDLTQYSSDSATPKKKRGRPSKNSKPSAETPTPIKKGQPSTKLSGTTNDPMNVSAEEVDSWELSDLANQGMRQHILVKLLRDAGAAFRHDLDALLKSVGRERFKKYLHAACLARRSESGEVTGLDDEQSTIMLETAGICLMWFAPTVTELEMKTMEQARFESTLNPTQILLFTNLLVACLQKNQSRLFGQVKPVVSKSKSSPTKPSSSSAPILISSSDETPVQDHNPHHKRKRQVDRSVNAENSRQRAFQRQQKFEESQTTNSAQLIAMASSQGEFSGVEINSLRVEDLSPVYVCDRIAREMKAHQIDGVRFLWREVTADDGGGAQGCVLAHTMGLGKSMQTIAVLVALNEAAHSKKRAVYSQLPSHLRPKDIEGRHLRMLIMCPPALLQNWQREIEQWAPKKLGHIFAIDSHNKASHLSLLEDWVRVGGVVLIGYQMFRGMTFQKAPKTNQKNALSEEDSERIKSLLAEKPEIVVADEVHNLKNNKSDLAKATNLIQTHTRIGLTGTPMSNDVREIYALVSWVAPGYLGDEAEFRAHYEEPIKEGLWVDSTAYEQRKSIKKLKVLQAEIQPKVNRANIEVLRGSLKPKIEFLITVPLGDIQMNLYKRYVNALLKGNHRDVSQVTIFAWLAVLTLLTNHPCCFYRKLKEVPPPARTMKKNKNQFGDGDTDTSGSRTPAPTESGSVTPSYEEMITTTEQLADVEAGKEAPGDESVQKLGFTPDMIDEILDGCSEALDPKLSPKVSIFLDLLNYSLDCGDKVLVFSHSIPTLNYLDELFHQQRKGFGRIDGQTSMKKRMEALEKFHNHEYDIMLVSTRAGGVGLNIQGANRVFIFDFGFNPTWEEQAIGRAYRLGQTKPVYVYRFVAGGTFETNIYNKQLFKSSLAQRVVDKKNPRRSAARNTREYLYEPTEVAQEDLGEWIGKDPRVLDRLLRQHGPEEVDKVDTMIRAIKTMETLQEEAMDAPLDEEEQKEVNEEIQQGKLRPRGRKAMNTAIPVPMRPNANGVVIPALPAPFTPAPTAVMQPGSSTPGGTGMRHTGAHGHPLGGLPFSGAGQSSRA